MTAKKTAPKDVNPRETGKIHRHEEIVRPILVKNIVQKSPLKDMYDCKERKHRSRDIDLPMRTINIHLSELIPGKSSRMHKHHNEAVVFILEGKGYSIVQGKRYDWEQGDALYMPSMNWHSHVNEGPDRVIYIGITNKRLLNFLGLDRWIEVGKNVTQEEYEEELKTIEPSPYSWVSITPEKGVKHGKGFKYL